MFYLFIFYLIFYRYLNSNEIKKISSGIGNLLNLRYLYIKRNFIYNENIIELFY